MAKGTSKNIKQKQIIMIFLGLGSNLSSSYGDRFKNIDLALSNLKDRNIKLVKKSSFYETNSYPDKNKPKFINIVVSIETILQPKDLMSVLITVEENLERKRNADLLQSPSDALLTKLAEAQEFKLDKRILTDSNTVYDTSKDDIDQNYKDDLEKRFDANP